jgi:hypothetical protein
MVAEDAPITPYLEEAVAALPRLLGGFDRNRASPTFGVGDRIYWAWGLIDFPNATFQGAVHGMARLWAHGLWPYATDPAQFVDRLDSAIQAIGSCASADGSLSEAFPNEGSWCVTALVAYDALAAIELMAQHVDADQIDRWTASIEPLSKYIRRNDETHAFITNHLATGAAALARWAVTTNCEASRRASISLIDRILSRQHSEGWYVEYQGFDAGYQSLATYYLADIATRSHVAGLGESLERSVDFVSQCVHPDGSFGGYYGSRNTRFYVPSGFHLLAPTSPTAAAIAARMESSVKAKTVVTLSSLDAPNTPPMFNAYCLAAVTPVEATAGPALAAERSEPARIVFPGAGLVFDRGPNHYTVVSTKKGGVVQHYVDGREAVVDCGVIYERAGQVGSTQFFDEAAVWDLDQSQLTVRSYLRSMVTDVPRPWQFAALRLGAITFLRIRRLREFLKRRLVSMLITGPTRWAVRNVRVIELGEHLTIRDAAEPAGAVTPRQSTGPFTALHMASQGYWQLQDEVLR